MKAEQLRYLANNANYEKLSDQLKVLENSMRMVAREGGYIFSTINLLSNDIIEVLKNNGFQITTEYRGGNPFSVISWR